MTASTVHPHHALTPDHPQRERLVDSAVWVMDWTGAGGVWLRHRAIAARSWLAEHLYGLVITLVALTFVTGLVLTLHLNDSDFWAILIALIGYPTIAASIAYHWGGTP